MFLSEFIKRQKSQADFAKLCGITTASLSTFLNKRRGFSHATMAKIVSATDGQVTYEDLVAEMQENQAARKKNGGACGQAAQVAEPGI